MTANKKNAMTCFLRSLAGHHPDIELRDAETVSLGRSPLTGIKNGKCSRTQVQLTADYSSYRVRQEGSFLPLNILLFPHYNNYYDARPRRPWRCIIGSREIANFVIISRVGKEVGIPTRVF
jgi:hypothetical protein